MVNKTHYQDQDIYNISNGDAELKAHLKTRAQCGNGGWNLIVTDVKSNVTCKKCLKFMKKFGMI